MEFGGLRKACLEPSLLSGWQRLFCKLPEDLGVLATQDHIESCNR